VADSGRKRAYWSRRQGLTPSLTLGQAVRLYVSILNELRRKDYFDEWFGYDCVDLNDVPGRAGEDRASFVTRRTFRDDLWPYEYGPTNWNEAGFLTAVEFYYDYVSKGVVGEQHSYNNCGWHWSEFDPEPARVEYLEEVNGLLPDYGDGFVLLKTGEVVRTGPAGLEPLLAASPPAVPGKAYQHRVDAAINKFRSRTSSVDDRRDAVRDLADVLEYLRPELKLVLTKKDDATLFEIANKFAIRHMDGEQFDDYTKPVWLSWMFYFYLATINAVAHLVERSAIREAADVPSPDTIGGGTGDEQD
jgi:hypothetical protein